MPDVYHDFFSLIIIYSSKKLALSDVCVIFLNTATDAAAALSATMFFAFWASKVGI